MGTYSLRRSKKRTMFKSSGNNRNHAPVKDRAGHIVNKSGYNEDLIEQKVMRRAAETTEILRDFSIEELTLLLDVKSVEAFKKYNDAGELVEVEKYKRSFSATDKYAIRELIKNKEKQLKEQLAAEAKAEEQGSVETPPQEVEKPEVKE